MDALYYFPRVVAFVIFFVDVKTHFALLDEEKFLVPDDLIDALVGRVNATDEFVRDGNVGF